MTDKIDHISRQKFMEELAKKICLSMKTATFIQHLLMQYLKQALTLLADFMLKLMG